MLINSNIKYSYNDVAIIPSVMSQIKHRIECNPFLSDGTLPIFASPMDTVVSIKNFELFQANHITPILPRNYPIEVRKNYVKDGSWAAFSLQEFEEIFTNADEIITSVNRNKLHVLIDVANGHMSQIYFLANRAKELYGTNIVIMIGNIANPLTYIEAINYNIDYVRVSIGTGNCCITSTQTGIHYPIASLIDEMHKIRLEYAESNKLPIDKLPKIVADGGCRNYSDIIKALALGADYVMVGSMFASLIESAAPLFLTDERGVSHNISHLSSKLIEEHGKVYNRENEDQIFNINSLHKETYGMASKLGLLALSGKRDKTAEGIKKRIPLNTNLYKWVINFIDYMRSAMSYTNTLEIIDFKNVNVIIFSNNTQNSINK